MMATVYPLSMVQITILLASIRVNPHDLPITRLASRDEKGLSASERKAREAARADRFCFSMATPKHGIICIYI